MTPNLRVILAVLLTYLLFYASAVFNRPPHSVLIAKPVKATRYFLYDTLYLQKERHPPSHWGTPRDDRTGVVVYNKNRAYDGLTFFSTSKNQSAYLIDMEGNVVHLWSLPYKRIWPQPSHVARIVPEHLHILERARLYPNGDILAIYAGVGSVPIGYGLAKIDKDSNLLWAYDDAIHHDAEVGPDGKIYTLSHRTRWEPYPGLDAEMAQPPLYEDFLVILSPEGKLIKKISFLDLVQNSSSRSILYHLRSLPTGGDTPFGDMLHPNALELIGDNLAGKAPMLKKGHILVSFRNISMLATIDPEAEQMRWAMFGPWRFQHDPRFLEDGTVILFDNEGHTGPGDRSRVIRVDLNTAEILWQYTGTEREPLYSQYHSSVDPLPNGNILITESLGGRLVEVAPDGDIIWDFRSPWRETGRSGKKKIPAFYRGRRYRPADLPFLKEHSGKAGPHIQLTIDSH